MSKKVNAVIAVKYLLVFLIAIIIIGVPIWLMVVNSLKTTGEAYKMSLSLPKAFEIDNYSIAIHKGNFWSGLKNTFIFTSFTLILVIFFGTMASWVLARGKSKFIKFIYFMCISGILIPTSIITSIRVLKILNIYSTYHGVVFFYTGIFLPFVIFFTTGFIKTIPIELEEAARIDGATKIGIFFKIIFPLLKPIILTNVIFINVFAWNDFLYPFYLVNTSKMFTLTLNLNRLAHSFPYQTNWELVFAGIIIVSSPLLLAFILFQRYIIKGIMGGAIKG